MYYRILNKKTNEIYFRMRFIWNTPLVKDKMLIGGKTYIVTEIKVHDNLDLTIDATGKMKLDMATWL